MVITVKKMTINCPKGTYMLGEASKGPVPVKCFIRKNDQTNQYLAYVEDDLSTDNIFGKVISVDGNPDLSELDLIIHSPYDFKITGLGPENNTMTGEITGSVVKNGNTSKVDDDLNAAFESAIKAGILDEEQKNLVLQIFDDHKIDPLLRLRCVKGYKKYNRPVKVPKSIFVNPDPSEEVSIFSQCLRMAIEGIPVVYKGDKSVGKNVCFDTISFVLMKPSYLVTFNRQMLPEDVYGNRTVCNSAADRLVPEAAEAYVEYNATKNNSLINKAAEFELAKAQAAVMNIVMEDSEFCNWLKDGGCMMFNEMNMAEANFFSSFANPLADGTGYLFIPGRGRMYINPDCVLIGSENENYTGTQDQNDATNSRFGAIEFPYPPSIANQLKSVTEGELGKGILKAAYYTQCDNLYKNWRQAVHNGQLSNGCLNIRGFVRALKIVANAGGFDTLANELNIQIVNMCDTDERLALRARIKESITL